MLYALLSWLTQRTQPYRSLRDFSGGTYVSLQNKSGPWPSGYIMTCMRGALSYLSCYMTMYLQNLGSERDALGQESLTTTTLVNLLFPYKEETCN